MHLRIRSASVQHCPAHLQTEDAKSTYLSYAVTRVICAIISATTAAWASRSSTTSLLVALATRLCFEVRASLMSSASKLVITYVSLGNYLVKCSIHCLEIDEFGEGNKKCMLDGAVVGSRQCCLELRLRLYRA